MFSLYQCDFLLDISPKPAGTIGKGHGASVFKEMCPPDGQHTYLIAKYAQSNDVAAKAAGFSAVKYTMERFKTDFMKSIIEKVHIEGTFKYFFVSKSTRQIRSPRMV